MITEEMLISAAAEVNEALLNSLPEEMPPYGKSPRFERKMRRVIRRGNHPAFYRRRRLAACYVLVSFLGTMSVLTLSPQARAAVEDWIREQLPNYVLFYYTGDPDGGNSDAAYELTYIPAGYTEISRKEIDAHTTLRYQSPDTEHLLFFSYSKDPDGICYYFEQEACSHRLVSIHGNQADFYEAASSDVPSALIWTSTDGGTFFFISGALPEEEIIKIAENVK